MAPQRTPTRLDASIEILHALEEATLLSPDRAGTHRAAGVRRRKVAAGEVITEADTAAAEIHIVVSGTVELCRPGDPRRVVISVLRAGGVFGDVPEVLGRMHHVDAVAACDTELASLAAHRLDSLLAVSPRLVRAWTVSLAERMLETHARLGELLAGHLDHRVASVLLRRADIGGRVDLTQEAMARLLGVQRSSINEVVRRLERRGLVRRGYGHVVVVDAVALAALASPGVP